MRTEGRPEGRRIRKRTCFVAATSSYLLTRWWRLLSSGRPSQPRRRRLHPPSLPPPASSPLPVELPKRQVPLCDRCASSYFRSATMPYCNDTTTQCCNSAIVRRRGGGIVRGVWFGGYGATMEPQHNSVIAGSFATLAIRLGEFAAVRYE